VAKVHASIAREIISYIVEPGYFIDMAPNREHNYCCGGGGGFNGIGLYRKQRNKALITKRDQILNTGAKLVLAPCHNRWSFLKPLILNMIEIPEHLKPKE